MSEPIETSAYTVQMLNALMNLLVDKGVISHLDKRKLHDDVVAMFNNPDAPPLG